MSEFRKGAAMAALLLVWHGLMAGPADAQTPAPTGAKATDAAAPLRFDILEFVIAGNTVLQPQVLEAAVMPYLGPGRSVQDAEAARKALQKAYQDAGYLSVNVELPPQRVDELGGEILLRVVEAPVAKLRVTGAEYFLPSAIAEQLPSLAPGSVPNFNDMQAELGAVSAQSGAREITPVIAAGAQPGTMDVELKVKDRLPVSSFVELNSKQSQNTTAGRLEASLSYDNLFQRHHALGLYWLLSPRKPDESNVLSLSYSAPFGGAGNLLALTLTHSASNTPTALGGATITRGDTLGLRWRQALRAHGDLQHALTWSATYRDLKDRNADVAGFEVPASPLRYPSFGLSYDLTRGNDPSGQFSALQAGLTFGLATLNRRNVDCQGKTVDQFACKRAGAQPGFQVAQVTLSHRQPLGRQWSVFGRVQGQLASGPLVPAEQITLGGVDSVRGYYDGEQAGDMAVAIRLELASPDWLSLDDWTLRGHLFHDRARLLKHDRLAGEIGGINMASAGIGLRLSSRIGLQAQLDWARVLNDTLRVGANGALATVSGAGAGRDSRWELSLRQTF